MLRVLIRLTLASVLLSACVVGINIAPPPNLYAEGTNYPEEDVPEILRTPESEIFFVTNRQPDAAGYGDASSYSMAFGAATVQFGEDLTWDQVVERTYVESPQRLSRLAVTDIAETVRFRETPLRYQRSDGSLRHSEPDISLYRADAAAFQDALRARIEATGHRRVMIYVHGFNNDFDFAVKTLANLWHFSGRETIPIAFTWPAGAGSGVLGYFRDRDAGRFSVYHAKEFLRLLADMPEVEQIDIVAHSRGSDVITTALRENMIFARGQGKHPKLALKTGTFIMAAPDLSIDIVNQRLAAERFSEAFEQINLYVNPSDTALRISSLLTRSTRLGSLTPEDFPPGEAEILRKEALVHFIRVEDVTGRDSHSYFRNNPAVLSDIVLALRTRAFPGGTLRPLEEDGAGFWVLHPNYPLDRLPDLEKPFGPDAR